jgi:hypothetical protein
LVYRPREDAYINPIFANAIGHYFNFVRTIIQIFDIISDFEQFLAPKRISDDYFDWIATFGSLLSIVVDGLNLNEKFII